MQDLLLLISTNKKNYSSLEYYVPLVEKAYKNIQIHPDICIETCKSLLEGMSKTVIENLNPNLPLNNKNYATRDIGFYVKECFALLKENDDTFEMDFSTRSVSLVLALGHLRNTRGDISHGRSVPKLVESSVSLAASVYKITEGLLLYMLSSYLKKKDAEEQVIDYDLHSNFNNYLDEAYPLEGKPLYSRALYDQYYEDYEIQLNEYLDQDAVKAKEEE